MHHIAIMKKSLGLIPKILSGDKTIESRWYKTRRAPWDRICAGDTVWFKNAGEDVIASASVSQVLQFTFADSAEIETILNQYYREIGFELTHDTSNLSSQLFGPGSRSLPKYCILVFLKNPQRVSRPFHINKSGFGNPTAWITVPNIHSITS